MSSALENCASCSEDLGCYFSTVSDPHSRTLSPLSHATPLNQALHTHQCFLAGLPTSSGQHCLRPFGGGRIWQDPGKAFWLSWFSVLIVLSYWCSIECVVTSKFKRFQIDWLDLKASCGVQFSPQAIWSSLATFFTKKPYCFQAWYFHVFPKMVQSSGSTQTWKWTTDKSARS